LKIPENINLAEIPENIQPGERVVAQIDPEQFIKALLKRSTYHKELEEANKQAIEANKKIVKAVQEFFNYCYGINEITETTTRRKKTLVVRMKDGDPVLIEINTSTALEQHMKEFFRRIMGDASEPQNDD